MRGCFGFGLLGGCWIGDEKMTCRDRPKLRAPESEPRGVRSLGLLALYRLNLRLRFRWHDAVPAKSIEDYEAIAEERYEQRVMDAVAVC